MEKKFYEMSDRDLKTILEYLSQDANETYWLGHMKEALKNKLTLNPDILHHRIMGDIIQNKWADPYDPPYSFKITQTGLNKLTELNEYEAERNREREYKKLQGDVAQSVLTTNEVSRQNIKRQSRLFWLTLGVAFIGAVGQWANWQVNRSHNMQSQKEVQDTTLLSLKKQQEFLMIRFDSLTTVIRDGTTKDSSFHH